MLFSFLNLSPRKQLKLRRQKASKTHMKWKQYEAIKADRLQRALKSLPIQEAVSSDLNECVEAVCAAAKCGNRKIKKKSGAVEKTVAKSELVRPQKRK